MKMDPFVETVKSISGISTLVAIEMTEASALWQDSPENHFYCGKKEHNLVLCLIVLLSLFVNV